ncbi:MAG: transcriptional regulator, partial [Deltaproteobacteria bacterium HGW-Deltaproteobacteria-24]
MLLTKKSEYALLSLISIAKSDEPKNVDVLSRELNISKSFLAKIMQNLAKYEIVKSYKGVNGGFVLNKAYDQITILE